MIVRENSQDSTRGIEIAEGLAKEEARDIIEEGGSNRPDSAISIKPISVTGTRRIVKLAFDYAIATMAAG